MKRNKKTLQQIFNTLKKNGTFVLFELNPYNPFTQLAFSNCYIDQNATMLYPGYAKQLLPQYGKAQQYYYCFFPSWLNFLRPSEKYLTWCPLEALYACITTKKDSYEKI